MWGGETREKSEEGEDGGALSENCLWAVFVTLSARAAQKNQLKWAEKQRFLTQAMRATQHMTTSQDSRAAQAINPVLLEDMQP